MSRAILFHFLCTQHVLDINISIIRSLRLCCWITTLVILFSVCCVLEIWCGWVWVVSVLQAEVVLRHWRSTEALCSSAWEVNTHCNSSCAFAHFVLSCNTPSSEPARICIRSYSTKRLGSRLTVCVCFALFCFHAIFMETCSFYTLHRWPLFAQNCAMWRIMVWPNPLI